MTESKLQSLLTALETSGAVSSSDKSLLKKEYLKVTGSELVTSTGCTNCYKDAVIVLLSKLRQGKILVSAGFVYELDGKLYGRHNITDAIALEIMKKDPETKIYFSK